MRQEVQAHRTAIDVLQRRVHGAAEFEERSVMPATSLERITEEVELPPCLVLFAHLLFDEHAVEHAKAFLEEADFPTEGTAQLYTWLVADAAERTSEHVGELLARLRGEHPELLSILHRAGEISYDTLETWPVDEVIRLVIATRPKRRRRGRAA